jgi:acetylornithine deacetylase/succinyl-diaminopimelate desuccinylase-like protein
VRIVNHTSMTKTLKLLRELIALPSVNPAFLPANDSRAGEQRVADFLAATAGGAGLDIEFQKVLPARSNLLVRLSPAGKVKQRILLAPHLDTVNVVTEDQFSPRVKGGRVYGRGASDTKGSVAAMLTALCELAKSKGRPVATEVVFAGLIDEENAQQGSLALVTTGFKADLAIVGEPTRLKVVTAHKGDVWLRLETHGKAAHGARPELGRNAVLEMAQIVESMETGYAAQLRKRRHPLLGRPTISVGSIAGGTQPNIVPAQCVMSADRRTIPGETEATVRREIKLLLRKNNLKATMASVKHAACLPLETNPRLPLVRQFLRSVGQAKPAGVDFFCDASVLSRGGIPSVVFGPGDIAQAHTADEWISLASLEQGKDLLVGFLKSLS